MASRRRALWSWALYDWANSAFATTVMAGFFPVFFKSYWSDATEVTESTFKLGIANSVASVVVALAAPVLGALADQAGRRKRWLLLFAFLGIVMSAGLFWVSQGQWMLAAGLYIVATVGFAGGNIFYDSLIVSVAEPRQRDRVSALGFSLGYLGGGLLFAFNVWTVQAPETFGFVDRAAAVRAAFVMVAAWWALFTVPLLVFVPEPPCAGEGEGQARAAFTQLMATLRRLRAPESRQIGLFLVAYWLYIDGVDTVIRMAVDYGMSLGFDTGSLMTALLVTQFVGFPAAIAYGHLGERVGTRPAILVGLVAYVGITVWGSRMEQTWEFYSLAVAIGLVQGGIQALSRSLYSRLIPREQAAQFFGLYNMLGKFAAVLGPLLMGAVGWVTGSPRIGMLSITVLLGTGGLLLWRVREPPPPT